MIGNNTVYLNEATVIEAVQMYLDSKFRDEQGPVVKSVKPSPVTGGYDVKDTFVVALQERQAKETA